MDKKQGLAPVFSKFARGGHGPVHGIFNRNCTVVVVV